MQPQCSYEEFDADYDGAIYFLFEKKILGDFLIENGELLRKTRKFGMGLSYKQNTVNASYRTKIYFSVLFTNNPLRK